MRCPDCGGKLRVVQVFNESGFVLRLRECEKCKVKYWTKEEIGKLRIERKVYEPDEETCKRD